ncbi:MAG: hypothetical protein GY913_18705 [Proteobacteria bacterium]|nr:hypothetical protein [Pseudomonadota bacterium]MCP4918941.1 hypothetical protein [Pseudomonadota bacterium]
MVSSRRSLAREAPLNASSTSREQLAQLLQTLETSPGDHQVRLDAAQTAVLVALTEGDPCTADVAEALVADLPSPSTPAVAARLAHIAATARGARRAIVLARRGRQKTPGGLAHAVSSEPDRLADEIEQCLDRGDGGLAQALAEVGVTQHPESARLTALRALVRGVRAA